MGKMAEQQRKLLEQMMGSEAMGITQINVDWWDPRVCRNFLCGTCPHEIFGNTKMDMGPCPKLHSDKIRKTFQDAKTANPSDPRFAAFEQEYQNNIYAFVDDCDRKIRMSQKRLEKTPEENRRTVDLMKEVGEIELAIQGQTEEIEQLGEAGKVEESMAKLEAVEALRSEKAEKERELQRLSETGGASGHQKLRVCETCGAYLSVLDSDRRLADHFGGKMHLGYHELRKLIESFNEQRQAARMNMNGPRPTGAPVPAAPSAPRGPVAPPPSGPSAPRMGGPPMNNGFMAPPPHPDQPMTPTGQIGLPVDPEREADSAFPGHGDKKRREAMELQQDSRHERSRDDDRDRRRDRSRDRSDRYRDRSRERTSRHDDRKDRERLRERDSRERDRDSRDRDHDRDRSSRDKDRSERREKARSRSRSPARRRFE